MKVTENTTLNEIISNLGWQDRAYMVDPMAKLDTGMDLDEGLGSSVPFKSFADWSLRKICAALVVWNIPSVAEGLQHLVDACACGQVFYDFRPGTGTGLAAFTLRQRSRCAVICAGGGYENVCSAAEGYPIAAALNKMGISAFVVHYRTGKDARAPGPMDDLAAAVRYIADNADALNVDMTDYALIGFSAGGHLAASFGTQTLGYAKYGLPKPGCVILGYPVITMGKHAHQGSRDVLLGPDAAADDIEHYSVERQVNSSYSPTFLWQCEADDCVPVENSRMMADALKKAGVPCKYEIFPGSAHGWGRGDGTTAEGWLDRAVEFCRNQERA